MRLIESYRAGPGRFQERWYRCGDAYVRAQVRQTYDWGERQFAVVVQVVKYRETAYDWRRRRLRGSGHLWQATLPTGLAPEAFTPAERRRFWGRLEGQLMHLMLEGRQDWN